MELSDEKLEDKVNHAVEIVRGDSWHVVDTFWVSDYINVGVGIDNRSDGDNGLSMQVEVIEPQKMIEPGQLDNGYKMREINDEFFELDRRLREAVTAVLGKPPVDEITYIGLAPSGYGNKSAVFDATVRQAD